MRLLFDQNRSSRLLERLADLHPDAAHVSALGLGRAQDIEVWEHARTSPYLLVSKDAEFAVIYLNPSQDQKHRYLI